MSSIFEDPNNNPRYCKMSACVVYLIACHYHITLCLCDHTTSCLYLNNYSSSLAFQWCTLPPRNGPQNMHKARWHWLSIKYSMRYDTCWWHTRRKSHALLWGVDLLERGWERNNRQHFPPPHCENYKSALHAHILATFVVF